MLGTRFIVETLSHAKEKAALPDFVHSLKMLYQSYIPGCRWFLETMLDDNMEWPRQLLFYCTTSDAREVFAGLVVSVIGNLIGAGERGLYGEAEEMEVDDEGADDDDEDELDSELIVVQDEKKRKVIGF